MGNIDKAFRVIDRADFVPKESKSAAILDMPIQIGYGQTNSQPTTVRLMLEWLDPLPTHNVLDVGSGSGWTTALLANIVGPNGFVFAVELVPELVELGRLNCEKLNIENVHFYLAKDDVLGLPEHAPYDCILVSASAQYLPTELLDQLRIHGKLVIPVQNDILEITKTSSSEYDTVTHPGFVFVPLL